jgi:hypothetical protein
VFIARKHYLISRVRSIIAQNHQIPLDELAQRLDSEFGFKIDRNGVWICLMGGVFRLST